MGISKSTRIIILLVIDSAFFLLELYVGMLKAFFGWLASILTEISGYAVHSLALVADSFHMVCFASVIALQSLIGFS